MEPIPSNLSDPVILKAENADAECFRILAVAHRNPETQTVILILDATSARIVMLQLPSSRPEAPPASGVGNGKV